MDFRFFSTWFPLVTQVSSRDLPKKKKIFKRWATCSARAHIYIYIYIYIYCKNKIKFVKRGNQYDCSELKLHRTVANELGEQRVSEV